MTRLALVEIAASGLPVLHADSISEDPRPNPDYPEPDRTHSGHPQESNPDSWRKLIERVEEVCDKWLGLSSVAGEAPCDSLQPLGVEGASVADFRPSY